MIVYKPRNLGKTIVKSLGGRFIRGLVPSEKKLKSGVKSITMKTDLFILVYITLNFVISLL